MEKNRGIVNFMNFTGGSCGFARLEFAERYATSDRE
jgi:hypothetical protein